MARALRITYPGSFHHVYSRGNQKQPIFICDEDRYYFLKVLNDAYLGFGLVVYAYCLMVNHYHLFAASLWGELSRALHLINTTYTVYFNKKHGQVGHLFQGRFKSILVEAEAYAWELSRYIHLNPVRAGLVGSPEDYPWSSYQDYLGMRRPASWLDTTVILHPTDLQSGEERAQYARFVLSGIGAAPPSDFDEGKRSGVLGTPQFKERIRTEVLGEQALCPDRERPQLSYFRERRPLVEIVALVNRTVGEKSTHAIGLAVLVCQKVAGYPLEQIGSYFGLSISGVSNRRRRIQAEIERSAVLSSALRDIIIQLRSKPGSQASTLSVESDDG
jgi:REP-associated tyrosine transposase